MAFHIIYNNCNKMKNLNCLIRKAFSLLTLMILFSFTALPENGYRLWLRYDLITDSSKLTEYRNLLSNVVLNNNSSTMSAIKEELTNGLNGLLGNHVIFNEKPSENSLIIGTPESLSFLNNLDLKDDLQKLGNEGFLIKNLKIENKKCIAIIANTDVGALYGSFAFLRLLQTESDISNLSIISSPKIQLRILDHWDNLNETVERGYAGESIWRWFELPEYQNPRYKDYARANASIGINGAVLNNVNASPLILSKDYLIKIASIAEVLRPYGIKVYLSINFSSPKELGGLSTSDPLNAEVIDWWKKKVDEIYSYIPDFGGFLVKANSEGLPGPMDFGRTHAKGANLLADALAPHGGIVMWRAFVYQPSNDDRAKQAYNEFKPLDGKFRKNVIIQVKNGPIDFQPREPFHPLFGAMTQTPLMMEFEITQEYLGFATHLVYLAPLYKECLESDTYAKGKGSTVAKVIDGSLFNSSLSGTAGVANIGSDFNWCGHPFGAANWYAFGRLAWDHTLTSEAIAKDWIKMTFSINSYVDNTILSVMLPSREYAVNYMTPLGLHHLMGWGHHYGPQPWLSEAERPDWNAIYYHKADENGIGFDRTKTGSNAVAQYMPEVADKFENIDSCPENLLLWFHHVPWNYKMKSGNILWNELCFKYYSGVDSVKKMQQEWNELDGKIDNERFQSVKARLEIQVREATWWRDACVLYFQTFSKMPIPEGLGKPKTTLDELKKIKWKYAPGI
jgi:alpha-glucuronidase